MLWQLDIQEVLFQLCLKSMSWGFNRRVSSVSQPSLFINPDTLVLRRWSFSVNLAALLWMSMLFCVYGFYATVPYSRLGLTNML